MPGIIMPRICCTYDIVGMRKPLFYVTEQKSSVTGGQITKPAKNVRFTGRDALNSSTWVGQKKSSLSEVGIFPAQQGLNTHGSTVLRAALDQSRDEEDTAHEALFCQQSNSASKGLVLGPGQGNSWDSGEVGSPVVKRFVEDDAERWLLWYHGRKRNAKVRESVGLAVSRNGIHWQRGYGASKSSADVGVVLECRNNWWAFDSETVRPCDLQILCNDKFKTVNGAAVYALYYMGLSSDKVDVPDVLLNETLSMGDYSLESAVLRFRPGMAVSMDGRDWLRVDGIKQSGTILDVGSKGEWDCLSICAPQMVIHGQDDLRMYYHSYDAGSGCFCVGVARSRYGSEWVKLGKILQKGAPGSFDELGITTRYVVRSENHNKDYLMLYQGISAEGRSSFGLARSPDGLRNWKRCQETPVFEPSTDPYAWDCSAVASPCLIKMSKDQWRLYYQGLGKDGGTGIGLAVSTDGSLTQFHRWDGMHFGNVYGTQYLF